LSDRLGVVISKLRNRGRLSEADVDEIGTALLEADVNVGVVRSVLMAAGDTFRAAAGEQLDTWATRTGAAIVRGAEGADPSSVVFDGVQSAAARGIDLVLADTAGRLQTNTNLMDELRKVRRVAEKAAGAVTEVLLVIDATTGQNGLVQARQFADATQVTGVVLTKTASCRRASSPTPRR
jgi:fused signal recognition particle receptor